MARTPQQNGMAERRNKTILERICCMENANNSLDISSPK